MLKSDLSRREKRIQLKLNFGYQSVLNRWLENCIWSFAWLAKSSEESWSGNFPSTKSSLSARCCTPDRTLSNNSKVLLNINFLREFYCRNNENIIKLTVLSFKFFLELYGEALVLFKLLLRSQEFCVSFCQTLSVRILESVEILLQCKSFFLK